MSSSATTGGEINHVGAQSLTFKDFKKDAKTKDSIANDEMDDVLTPLMLAAMLSIHVIGVFLLFLVRLSRR